VDQLLEQMKKFVMGWGVAQVAKCLPSKGKAMVQSPGPYTKKAVVRQAW
jgi:hypothetical protein